MKILLYFLILHLLLIIPGFVVVKKINMFKDSAVTQLALGYALTTTIFSLAMLFGYATGLSYNLIRIMGIALITFSLYLFIRDGYWRSLLQAKIPLIALGVLSLLSTILILLPFTKPTNFIPDPEFRQDRNYSVLNVKVLNIVQTSANDNYIPYRQAQFILNRSNPTTDSFISEWGVHFFQRTPLMGGVVAFILNLFGDTVPVDYSWSAAAQDPGFTYMKFQLIAHILNAVFLLPAYALILYFFSRKTAEITVLLLSVSQFFVYNSIFSWPKSFTAFFILLSWVVLFTANRKYALVGGLIGGIAYLSHDLAVLYIGTSIVMLLSQKRFRDALYSVAGLLVAAIPWFFTSSIIFKKTSSFIYYPFSLRASPQPENQGQIIREFLHTSPFTILWIKVQSLFYLLSPYQLLVDESGQAFTKRLWALSIFSLPGAVGLGIIPFTVGGFFKSFKNKFLLLGLTFLPILFCVLVIGWPRGLGALHFAQPSVVLLSALGVYFLLTLPINKIWAMVAYVLTCIHLFYSVLYSYGLDSILYWISHVKSLVAVIVMLGIIITAGTLIFIAPIDPKSRKRGK